MSAPRKIAAIAVALWLILSPLGSAQFITIRKTMLDVQVWVHMNVSGEISVTAWSRNGGRELFPVLAQIVHCQGSTRPDGPEPNAIICSKALSRDGLALEGVVDLAPIARSLDPSTSVELWVDCPRLGFASSSLAMTEEAPEAARWSRSIQFQAGKPPSPIHIRFGCQPGQLAPIYLPLVALALALTLIAVIMSATGFATLSRSAVLLGTIVWVATAAQLGADNPLRILLYGKFYASLVALLVEFWPPLICIALGVGLGSRLRARQARKTTAGQVLSHFAVIPLLLTCAVGALPSFTNGRWPIAVLWLAATPVFLLLRRAWLRSRGNSTRMLAGGELKERVSALAARAGCPQVKLYVSFSARSDISNAFALPGKFILITAALIRSLSKREVDAVAAHELSHFRHSSRGVWMALVLAMFMSMTPFRDLFLYLPGGLFAVMLVPITVYLVSLRGMRKREFAADAASAGLTGDPQAMISALARIDRGNGRLKSNAFATWFSDHPSISARIGALAALARLDTAAVERLMTSDDPGDRYEIPERAVTGTIFTLQWQKTNAHVYSWLVLLVSSVAGLLAAWLLNKFGGKLFGDYRTVQLIAGIAFGCILTKALASTWMSSNFARLGRRLRTRLGVGGQLVGLAIDSDPRIYNGFRFSDAGLMRFEQGRLCYQSERITIALNPADVTEVGMVASSPSNWVRRQPMVRFRHPETGAVQAFILHPVNWFPSQRRLLKRIQQWRRVERSPEPTSLTGFSPVAGQQFSRMTVARAAAGFRITGGLTLALAFMARWSIPANWSFVACAFIVSAGAYLVMVLPAMIYRPDPHPPELLAPAQAGN